MQCLTTQSVSPVARRGGYVDLSNWRNRVWNPARKAIGLDATPYDLRHTFCSLLAHEGRSMPYTAREMGHNLLDTQKHYPHILEEEEPGTRTSMADAIAEARVHFVCSTQASASSEHLAEVVDLQAYRTTGAAGIEPATLSLEGSCSIH
jgi:hypothetical protein